MKEHSMAGVTSVIPALTARTQLGQILRRVRDRQERFLISRRGEAQAVIMSVEAYLRSVVNRPEAITALREAAKRCGVDRLSMPEIDAEVTASCHGR
jgi:prevent-host-death family protein